jgi:hypothetical protein
MATITINAHTVIKSSELNDFDEVDDLATSDEKLAATQAWLLLLLVRAGVEESQVTATGAGQLRSLAAYDLLERYYAEIAREMSAEEGFASKREYWAGRKQEEMDLIFGTDPPLIDIDPSTTDKPGGELRQIWIGE